MRRRWLRRGRLTSALAAPKRRAHMKRCPACGSTEIYQCEKYYRYSGCGEEILPKLAPGLFSGAKIRPTVCLECGHIGLFASEDARRKANLSQHWKPVADERA